MVVNLATYFSSDAPFSVAPVTFQKKKVLDDWQDPLKPLPSKYVSNFSVEYDTDYELRVRFLPFAKPGKETMPIFQERPWWWTRARDGESPKGAPSCPPSRFSTALIPTSSLPPRSSWPRWKWSENTRRKDASKEQRPINSFDSIFASILSAPRISAPSSPRNGSKTWRNTPRETTYGTTIPNSYPRSGFPTTAKPRLTNRAV